MTSLISAIEGTFFPLTIIIMLFSIVGSIGNGITFYIFRWRFPSTGFNLLMAALAAFDLMACLIHMPLDIATFYDVGEARIYLCKVTCFQLAFTTIGSALVLMSIAFTRYYGIHKPLLGTLSSKLAGYLILGSSLMAVGISLPITVLFGEGSLVTAANITAEICAVEKEYMDSMGPLIYYIILGVLYIISFIINTFLYARCVHTVWSRRKVFTRVQGRGNCVVLTPRTARAQVSSELPSSTELIPDTPSQRHSTSPLASSKRESGPTAASTSSAPDVIRSSMETADKGQVKKTPSNDSKDSTKDLQRPPQNKRLTSLSLESESMSMTSTGSTASATSTKRGSVSVSVSQTNYWVLVVVIAITATYFLSYVPHFCIMFYLFNHDMSVFEASAQELSFELLMRSFFLNSILDPLIYGVLSKEFRKEFCKIMSDVLKCFKR